MLIQMKTSIQTVYLTYINCKSDTYKYISYSYINDFNQISYLSNNYWSNGSI